MNDAATIPSIIKALYDVISGAAGEERDWERDRRLFFPGARMIRTSVDNSGRPQAKAMSVDEYIEDVKPYFAENSFYEYETGCKIQHFGNIAHAFSSYEAKQHPDDAVAFKRGINSIQLYHDGHRWWIVNMIWDNERPAASDQ